MTKKEVKKVVKQSLLSGKTKQETFEELEMTSEFPPEKLARIIRGIPTLQARKKHKTLNIILITLLSLTILFKVLAGIPIVVENGIKWIPILFLLPIINIILLVGVATYSQGGYKAVAILTILGVLQTFGKMWGEPFDPFILIDFVVAAGLITLGFYLNSKFFPEYLISEECYRDSEGEYKLKYVIQFED